MGADVLGVEEGKCPRGAHAVAQVLGHTSLALGCHRGPREVQPGRRRSPEAHQALNERKCAAQRHELEPELGIRLGPFQLVQGGRGVCRVCIEADLAAGGRARVLHAVGQDAHNAEHLHAVQFFQRLWHRQNRACILCAGRCGGRCALHGHGGTRLR
eukprot:scaffold13576_cov125-Isochrysis_galbana.AAC.9